MSDPAYAKVQVQQKTLTGSAHSSHLLQRRGACGQHTIADGACEACRQKREGALQRSAVTSTPMNTIPPIVHEVLSSPGQPLDSGTRAFMEPRFGYDFSQVRVHTDGKAAESARAVKALAYTIGHNVVFGAEQYASTTPDGRRLMAHELTHVIQQDDNAYAQRRNTTIGPKQDAHEREAEHLALLIGAHREAGRVDSPGTARVLQRQPAPSTDDPQKTPGKKEAITQPPPQKIPAPEAKKEDKAPAKPDAKAEKEGVEKAASVGLETETKREEGKTTTEVAGKFSFELTIPITDKIELGPFSFLKEAGVEASAGLPTKLELETTLKMMSIKWKKVKILPGFTDFGISASALASAEYSLAESKGAAKFGVASEAEAKYKRREESPWFITVKGGVEMTYDKEGNAEFKMGSAQLENGSLGRVRILDSAKVCPS